MTDSSFLALDVSMNTLTLDWANAPLTGYVLVSYQFSSMKNMVAVL